MLYRSSESQSNERKVPHRESEYQGDKGTPEQGGLKAHEKSIAPSVNGILCVSIDMSPSPGLRVVPHMAVQPFWGYTLFHPVRVAGVSDQFRKRSPSRLAAWGNPSFYILHRAPCFCVGAVGCVVVMRDNGISWFGRQEMVCDTCRRFVLGIFIRSNPCCTSVSNQLNRPLGFCSSSSTSHSSGKMGRCIPGRVLMPNPSRTSATAEFSAAGKGLPDPAKLPFSLPPGGALSEDRASERTGLIVVVDDADSAACGRSPDDFSFQTCCS